MDNEKGNNKNKRIDDVFSKSLRAGNRTYFFDVKSTKSDDLYLTITESKRRFNNDNGKFFYEKHKLFLYPEDFQSFTDFLKETLEKIDELNGGKEIIPREELEAQRQNNSDSSSKESKESKSEEKSDSTSEFSDVNFEDLGKDKTE